MQRGRALRREDRRRRRRRPRPSRRHPSRRAAYCAEGHAERPRARPAASFTPGAERVSRATAMSSASRCGSAASAWRCRRQPSRFDQGIGCWAASGPRELVGDHAGRGSHQRRWPWRGAPAPGSISSVSRSACAKGGVCHAALARYLRRTMPVAASERHPAAPALWFPVPAPQTISRSSVVVRRDRIAFGARRHPRCPPHTLAGLRGQRRAVNARGWWRAGSGRVLGADARPMARPVDAQLVLLQRQRLAAGDAQLPLHQIQPGDRLGDRMLHLQPVFISRKKKRRSRRRRTMNSTAAAP